MIKVYCNKLENGNLEITQDMLTDILSYMKRQDNIINGIEDILKTLMFDSNNLNHRLTAQIIFLNLNKLKGSDKDVSSKEL